MITTHRPTTSQPTAASLLGRLRGGVTWPFTSRYAAPIWLALRLYIGWIWLGFAVRKFETGWLTSDPMGAVIGRIADGKLPVAFAPFRDFCAFLMDAGLTPMLSFSMPFLELAVALAFFSGILVAPAAVGGIILLVNFLMSGIGTVSFEGRMIAAHLLLVLAYQVAGTIGLQALVLRVLRAMAERARPGLGRRLTPAAPGR